MQSAKIEQLRKDIAALKAAEEVYLRNFGVCQTRDCKERKDRCEMSWKITAEQIADHPIYGEIESISENSENLLSSEMAAIANLFVEHGFLRPVPKWICVNVEPPPIDKLVVLRLKSGEEILGGLGESGDDFPWCRAYWIEWDKESQSLKCIDFIESDIEPTHWREV